MLWYCLHSHLFFLISLLPATSSYVVSTPILPLKLLWPATNGISVTKSLFLSYVASQEHWLILYSWNILFPWLPRTTLWLFLSPSVDKFLSVWCSLFFLSPILKSVVLIFFFLDYSYHSAYEVVCHCGLGCWGGFYSTDFVSVSTQIFLVHSVLMSFCKATWKTTYT